MQRLGALRLVHQPGEVAAIDGGVEGEGFVLLGIDLARLVGDRGVRPVFQQAQHLANILSLQECLVGQADALRQLLECLLDLLDRQAFELAADQRL